MYQTLLLSLHMLQIIITRSELQDKLRPLTCIRLFAFITYVTDYYKIRTSREAQTCNMYQTFLLSLHMLQIITRSELQEKLRPATCIRLFCCQYICYILLNNQSFNRNGDLQHLLDFLHMIQIIKRSKLQEKLRPVTCIRLFCCDQGSSHTLVWPKLGHFHTFFSFMS